MLSLQAAVMASLIARRYSTRSCLRFAAFLLSCDLPALLRHADLSLPILCSFPGERSATFSSLSARIQGHDGPERSGMFAKTKARLHGESTNSSFVRIMDAQ
jgi:hypothetical protein